MTYKIIKLSARETKVVGESKSPNKEKLLYKFMMMADEYHRAKGCEIDKQGNIIYNGKKINSLTNIEALNFWQFEKCIFSLEPEENLDGRLL